MKETRRRATGDGTTRADVWYRSGLRFSCTRCGDCCTGGPGTVRITEEDVTSLARFLGIGEEEFRARYTRDVGENDLSLSEKPNHDCVFWDSERGCTVYRYRPRQCRTWPFWHVNVSTRADWEAAAARCPGMDQGPLFDADYVERTSADDGTLGSARRLRRTT